MFIKNLKTGVTWEIVDPELIRRLKSEPLEFQEIEEPKANAPAGPGGQDPGGNAPEPKKQGR